MFALDLLKSLRGFSTPVGGVSWSPPASERDAAQRLMVYLYDRRVLYAPSEAEVPDHVVRSVLDIRRELTDIAKQFRPGDELELKLRAMRGACVHFLNRVQKREEVIRFGSSRGHWASWEFIDALGQWRAFMVVYVAMIASMYNITPPSFLPSLIPPLPEEEPREPEVSASSGSDLLDRFAALPKAEQRRQIEELNRYLHSAEGQREFGSFGAPESSLEGSTE